MFLKIGDERYYNWSRWTSVLFDTNHVDYNEGLVDLNSVQAKVVWKLFDR